jgi:hypothetical protein
MTTNATTRRCDHVVEGGRPRLACTEPAEVRVSRSVPATGDLGPGTEYRRVCAAHLPMWIAGGWAVSA